MNQVAPGIVTLLTVHKKEWDELAAAMRSGKLSSLSMNAIRKVLCEHLGIDINQNSFYRLLHRYNLVSPSRVFRHVQKEPLKQTKTQQASSADYAKAFEAAAEDFASTAARKSKAAGSGRRRSSGKAATKRK